MAKYLVTNGSNFQPFTYEELSRPLYEMAEAKRASQDQYDALSMQTEALRRYISNNEGDKEAKRLYDNYVSELSELQNNLWEHGYTPSTRRNLSLARKGFFSDIQRISKAIQTRQESSLKWREAVKNDPSLVTSGDPGLDGLDAYLVDDLHGSEWYSYSGNKFMSEVGADAKTRINELFQDIRERIRVEKDPRMKGYLMTIITPGANSQQVDKAAQLVRAAVEASKTNPDAMNIVFNNSTPEGILANVLMNHLNDTGAKGKVSDDEFDRLVNKGIEGLSYSIGDPKVETRQDLEWAESQRWALENHKHNLAMERLKKAAELKNNNTKDGSLGYGPQYAKLRGNNIVGEMGKEMTEKQQVLNALMQIDVMKKTNTLKDPKTNKPKDDLVKTLNSLKNNDYYNKLTNGQQGFVLTTDLAPIIYDLKSEINKAVTNDHQYYFTFDESAAMNFSENVIKRNLQSLYGKKKDNEIKEVAKYSNGESPSARELQSLLSAKKLDIGFDAKNGKITVRRKAGDGDSNNGTYDDRIVYLDPETVLAGTSGYANKDAIRYAFDSALPEMSEVDKKILENQLIEQASSGEVVNLIQLCDLITKSYNSMVVNGDVKDRAIFNALVDSFASGLFDESNIEVSPNPIKEGHSQKTAGLDIDDDFIDSFIID